MYLRLTAICAFAAFLLFPATAWAGDWYSSVYGGISHLNDAAIDPDASTGITGDAGFDNGYAVGLSVGRYIYYPNNPWTLRSEFDLNYRKNDIDELSVAMAGGGSGSTHNVDGNQSSVSALANLWFDYDTKGPITPYLGGGLGIASVRHNDVEVLGADIDDDSDTVLAYQFGAGLTFGLTKTLSLSADYRYFATKDAELNGYEIENDNNSVILSLRYRFE